MNSPCATKAVKKASRITRQTLLAAAAMKIGPSPSARRHTKIQTLYYNRHKNQYKNNHNNNNSGNKSEKPSSVRASSMARTVLCATLSAAAASLTLSKSFSLGSVWMSKLSPPSVWTSSSTGATLVTAVTSSIRRWTQTRIKATRTSCARTWRCPWGVFSMVWWPSTSTCTAGRPSACLSSSKWRKQPTTTWAASGKRNPDLLDLWSYFFHINSGRSKYVVLLLDRFFSVLFLNHEFNSIFRIVKPSLGFFQIVNAHFVCPLRFVEQFTNRVNFLVDPKLDVDGCVVLRCILYWFANQVAQFRYFVLTNVI